LSRILLGWELGAGTGHVVMLSRTAEALRACGHEAIFAVQHIGAMPAGSAAWQAPLWPQQLTTQARRAGSGPATMGDILAVLGLADGRAVAAMVTAWENILAVTRPHAIIAEYAPMLLVAANGRVPTLSTGTGFSLPPAYLPSFPTLTGQPAAVDEPKLLHTVNAALASVGRPTLPGLPALFTADRTLPAAFAEFDPYRSVRREGHGAPSLSGAIAESRGDGDELFAYMSGSETRPNAFWNGLVRSGVPVRVYDARLTPADRDVLERAGVTVEIGKVPFDRIVERSRIVMSHGGLGFVSSALIAGLPQIVAPFDLEKRLISASVVGLRLGVEQRLAGLEADSFANLVRRTMADQALVDRARAAAPSFRARAARSSTDEIADAIQELL